MSHAHPTFAEAMKEAAMAATDNRPLRVACQSFIFAKETAP
jgi:hypothetical protein